MCQNEHSVTLKELPDERVIRLTLAHVMQTLSPSERQARLGHHLDCTRLTTASSPRALAATAINRVHGVIHSRSMTLLALHLAPHPGCRGLLLLLGLLDLGETVD